MELQKLSKCFKALSNPQRLRLFLLISDLITECRTGSKADKTCFNGIEKAFTLACGRMKLSRSTISHHFKELQNAGLITCERTGQSCMCRINEDAVKMVKGFSK